MEREERDALEEEIGRTWSTLRLALGFGVAGVLFLWAVKMSAFLPPFHPLAAQAMVFCSAAQLVVAAFGTLRLQRLLRIREILALGPELDA